MRRARVIGPIEGTRPPWGRRVLDLGARGYVCEEYQLEGTAVAYRQPGEHRPPINGRWSAEATGEAPYRTRILVVRPRGPLGFNGTVVVHWQNVSAGFEMGRPESDELYVGYAWVGVSAQEVGLYGSPMGLGARGAAGRGHHGRRGPERYGALVHPGELGSFEISDRRPVQSGPIGTSRSTPWVASTSVASSALGPHNPQCAWWPTPTASTPCTMCSTGTC